MIDFNATPEERQSERQRLLQLRAEIRALNETYPRCACCGADMPKYTPDYDLITAEQLADPGYDYLVHDGFSAGDLICFWCVVEMADIDGQFQWGRA